MIFSTNLPKKRNEPAKAKWKHFLVFTLAFCAVQTVLYPASPNQTAITSDSALVLSPSTDIENTDNNAALRYVSAAAHLGSAPAEFPDAVLTWLAGQATDTLAAWATDFASQQTWSRTFLLLGDQQPRCSFTPDNDGFEQYEMPPCAALEQLSSVQIVAALHLPELPPASAAHLLTAVFRMGDRLSHHGVLFSRMSGTRIRRIALAGMRHLLQRPDLHPSAASFIIDRLDRLPALRQEVTEQIRLDFQYLSAVLSAGKNNPQLLLKFALERHPSVLNLPVVSQLLKRKGGSLELAASIVKEPIWENWTAGFEKYFTEASAIEPLSSTATDELIALKLDPAFRENPLIDCLSWNFSRVHQILADVDLQLAEVLAAAKRCIRHEQETGSK